MASLCRFSFYAYLCKTKIKRKMKKLVLLTGAGMSAESGFSTFRDSQGLWEKHSVEDVATPEGWERNPDMVTDFYNSLRHDLITGKPNQGHYDVAALENDYEVVVVTQNVDDLHERAGSTNVIHLHGELMKMCSTRNPNDPRYIRTLQPEEWEVPRGTMCEDGSLLRPWIVFFGEPVPNLDAAAREVSEADALLIVGTSLVVYPAASLIHYVKSDAPVLLVDPKPVQVNSSRHVEVIQDVASKGVAKAAELLKRML